MGLIERLGGLFADRREKTSKDRPVTVYDDTWSYGVYHSPEDWEAHRQKKLQELEEEDKDIEEQRAKLRAEPHPSPPSISPYGGGGRLTEKRNIGERSDRERGWTV